MKSVIVSGRVERATALKVALIARRLGLTENSLTRLVLRAVIVGPDGRLRLVDVQDSEQADFRPAS